MGIASDVFALGATLYCLLTGQAPYGGTEALIQAAMVEFVPARQRKRTVPAALEALCGKAMAARPEDRYPTATALAEEVQCWLADEPVRAYREPWSVRAGRWLRRHRVLVASVAVVVLVALVLGTAGGVYRQQRQMAREQAKAGLVQSAQLRDGYRYADAGKMLEQVRGWVRQAADGELDGRLKQAEADLDLARGLDDVRQRAATAVSVKWNPRRMMRAEYPEVLARHGLDVLEGDLDELAEKIRASAVRESIMAALDDWAMTETDSSRKQRLLRLANSADEPDLWRQAIREAVARRDRKRLRELVRGNGDGKPTPGVVQLISSVFSQESQEATALLRRMQLKQPRDFWVSFNLGNGLRRQEKHQEAAACFLVAVALRPESAPAHSNLGLALYALRKVDEAIVCYNKAIELDPKLAIAHNNLGGALHDKEKVEEAIACVHKAIELDPKLAPAHYNLGIALKAKGKVEEAIECYRNATQLDPTFAPPHFNLGAALQDKGKVDEAIACYRRAIELDPKHTKAHINLGNVLQGKGKVDDAIECFHRAIRLDPNDAKPHYNLGNALKAKGKVDEAIACFRKAILLDPKSALAHGALGQALLRQGEFSEAQKSLRRCLTLLPPSHPARGYTLNLVQQCQQLLAADSKLQAYLAGKGAPADAVTQVQMANLAQQPYKRLYSTAARLDRDAFAGQPALASSHRYDAACAAALAGTGQGKDAAGLDDEQRAQWRKQARDWLAADLAAYTTLAKKAGARATVQKGPLASAHWLKDADLAAVRDEPALAKLPEKEREAWRKLWADVAALLKKLEQKETGPAPPQPPAKPPMAR